MKKFFTVLVASSLLLATGCGQEQAVDNTASEKIAELQQNLELSKKSLEESESNYKTTLEELQITKSNLKESEAEVERLNEELSAAQYDAEVAERKVVNKEIVVEKVKTEFKEIEKDNSRLKTAIMSLEGAKDNLDTASDGINSAIDDINEY